jgi:fumarylacetoacetase
MLYDIALEVALTPQGGAETVIARTNYAEMYYSAAQQLAHHTTCGCPMNVGRSFGVGHHLGARQRTAGAAFWNCPGAARNPLPSPAAPAAFIEDQRHPHLARRVPG